MKLGWIIYTFFLFRNNLEENSEKTKFYIDEDDDDVQAAWSCLVGVIPLCICDTILS